MYDRKSFCIGCGRNTVKSFCSLEKINLFPLGPHITAVFSPRMLVLKMSCEYFFILSPTKFSGLPNKNSMVSPMIGQPKLPGGSLTPESDWRRKVKRVIARDRKTRTIERDKASMGSVVLVVVE